jgi:phosphatidyl-myo-inositol dimannoside synthase
VRSLLVTPNLLGRDGISSLSRQLRSILPEPVVALTLHDARADDGGARRSAGGRVPRFLADAARLALQTDAETIVVCAHLHLAPVARFLAPRAVPPTYILCGIEAWVPVRPTERWALGSGRLVAISEHTARRFKAANPAFACAHVDVCHPGLPPASSGGGAATLAGPPAALIVGRMARGERYKGHELLIDLWPRVQRAHPSAQLWMVGDGDDRQRLEALARDRGLGDAVIFAGAVSERELDDLYRRCRFFVLPSRDEGFGLVFLEAMRAGKACVGSRGAAEEIIDHGTTGLIVDAHRPDDVCAAMIRLFSDAALCAAMGRAGADRFTARFTDVAFAKRFDALVLRRAQDERDRPPVPSSPNELDTPLVVRMSNHELKHR